MEKVDVYNKKREKVGKIVDRNNIGKDEYRLSVHIWIANQDKILIQKRTSNKKIFPNLWEQTGGGVLAGETSISAVKRESKEELNIDVSDNELTYIGSYVRVNDIVDIWLIEKDLNIENCSLQKEEVADAKLVTFNEFENMIENNEVVPTINPSYNLLKNYFMTYKKGKIM